MLHILIKNLLSWFYRKISIIAALIVIINHLYAKEQLDQVNCNFIIISLYINILLLILFL